MGKEGESLGSEGGDNVPSPARGTVRNGTKRQAIVESMSRL